MAKTFTTMIGLENFVESACKIAIESACNRLLGTLQQYILTEYYDDFTPEYYRRKYQFFESAMTQMLNNTTGKVFMNPNAMNYGDYWDGETQINMAARGYHGSAYIKTEGKYWDSFMKFCEQNAVKILKEEIVQELARHRLTSSK